MSHIMTTRIILVIMALKTLGALSGRSQNSGPVGTMSFSHLRWTRIRTQNTQTSSGPATGAMWSCTQEQQGDRHGFKIWELGSQAFGQAGIPPTLSRCLLQSLFELLCHIYGRDGHWDRATSYPKHLGETIYDDTLARLDSPLMQFLIWGPARMRELGSQTSLRGLWLEASRNLGRHMSSR